MLTSLLALTALAQPAKVWGVTIDDISGLSSTIDSVRGLLARPTTRVVFDGGMEPGYYASAVHRLHAVAGVLGEPVDSEPTNSSLTVGEYRTRFQNYLDALGKDVDVWEVGNEINGDWTGDSATVASKVQAAYDEVKTRGKKAAITLYYEGDYAGTDREMVAWARKYLSSGVRNGADYVLVSFYPTSATGAHPNWGSIFSQLSTLFPNAKLGFGELGLANADGSLNKNLAQNENLIRRYYRMAPPVSDRWVGGFFWWEFRQDAAPKAKRLWKVFFDVVR